MTANMPQYSRPFTVWALKITAVVPPSDFAGTMLVPADAGYSPFPVPAQFVQDFAPAAGDYFVVYASGYQTMMKAADFEAAYTAVGQPAPDQSLT